MRTALIFLPTALLLLGTTVARADITPDPAITTGFAAIGLGILVLLAFGAVILIRRLRRSRH